MTLYKYSNPKWGIAILQELRLKVSPPNRFNDPFEFTPQTLNPMKDAKCAYVLWQRGRSSCSFVHFQETIWPVMRQDKKFIKAVTEFMRGNVSDDLNEINMASEIVGVLCLSKRPDDMRMWSQYTNDHRGVAIGLDVGDVSFRKAKFMSEINYTDERATWDLLLKPNTKE